MKSENGLGRHRGCHIDDRPGLVGSIGRRLKPVAASLPPYPLVARARLLSAAPPIVGEEGPARQGHRRTEQPTAGPRVPAANGGNRHRGGHRAQRGGRSLGAAWATHSRFSHTGSSRSAWFRKPRLRRLKIPWSRSSIRHVGPNGYASDSHRGHGDVMALRRAPRVPDVTRARSPTNGLSVTQGAQRRAHDADRLSALFAVDAAKRRPFEPPGSPPPILSAGSIPAGARATSSSLVCRGGTPEGCRLPAEPRWPRWRRQSRFDLERPRARLSDSFEPGRPDPSRFVIGDPGGAPRSSKAQRWFIGENLP